ncbi:ester cyclase [Amycolatopsis sp. FDAARGOS 1241]|uniref:ester cyclase n=1 Tax=Amycolatopsis sp. FDAARGOS 1241 TaxID=2778070 RepID=UPI001EF1EC2C|nr:nuclear transport factor 2 family protein [Amycolatopsis sp. FDAARGOS 1241]
MPNSVALVEAFWDAVWNAHDADAADDFVVEDFVITNAGVRIEGRENFKTWIRAFLDQVLDLRLEVAESFQNHDGSRVASRWTVHGRNNGLFGLEPDGRPISFSGTAVWEIEDGKLVHNHVERAAHELHQRLLAA